MVIRDIGLFLTHARLLEERLKHNGEGLTGEHFQEALEHYRVCVLVAFWLSEDIHEIPLILENTSTEITSFISAVLQQVPLSVEEQAHFGPVMSRPSKTVQYKELRQQILERCETSFKENPEQIRNACKNWINRADELLVELEDHYSVESFRRTVRNIYHVLKDVLLIARRKEFQPKTISKEDTQAISAFVTGLSLGSLLSGILYIFIHLLLPGKWVVLA